MSSPKFSPYESIPCPGWLSIKKKSVFVIWKPVRVQDKADPTGLGNFQENFEVFLKDFLKFSLHQNNRAKETLKFLILWHKKKDLNRKNRNQGFRTFLCVVSSKWVQHKNVFPGLSRFCYFEDKSNLLT